MPPEPRKNGPAAPRILIVDDDSGQRSLLDSFLRSQGFETVPVASGEQALETLRTGEISMMISDVRMPGLSGLETTAARAQGTRGPAHPAGDRLRRHPRGGGRHARRRAQLPGQAD